MKCLYPRGDTASQDRGDKMRQQYLAYSNCCWVVMADSVVVGQNGRLLSGVDAIMLDPENLQDGVELVQD